MEVMEITRSRAGCKDYLSGDFITAFRCFVAEQMDFHLKHAYHRGIAHVVLDPIAFHQIVHVIGEMDSLIFVSHGLFRWQKAIDEKGIFVMNIHFISPLNFYEFFASDKRQTTKVVSAVDESSCSLLSFSTASRARKVAFSISESIQRPNKSAGFRARVDFIRPFAHACHFFIHGLFRWQQAIDEDGKSTQSHTSEEHVTSSQNPAVNRVVVINPGCDCAGNVN